MNLEQLGKSIKLYNSLLKLNNLDNRYIIVNRIYTITLFCKLNNNNDNNNLDNIKRTCIFYGINANNCNTYDDVIVLLNQLKNQIVNEVNQICINEITDKIEEKMIKDMFNIK